MFGTPRRWANPITRIKSPDTHVVAFAERFRTRGQYPAPPPNILRAGSRGPARRRNRAPPQKSAPYHRRKRAFRDGFRLVFNLTGL